MTLPFPWQEFWEARGRQVRDAGQGIGEPRLVESTSFSHAVMMRVSMAAARSALRSEPAKSHAFLPQATPRSALSAALFVMQILPSSA